MSTRNSGESSLQSDSSSLRSSQSSTSNRSEKPQQLLDRPSSEISRRQTMGASIALTRTETAQTLQELGVRKSAPVPDVVAPTYAAPPVFPEEYTMETPSGVVPLTQLETLGRQATNLSRRTTERPPVLENLEEVETAAEKEEDMSPHFVTFVTNDPENPHNWAPMWRWIYTVLLSTLVICAAYGSACVAGGLGTIQKKYHVGQEVAILSVSLMVIGFALGPLIWSPFSDLYGRRATYFVSMGLYVIFNIPCALSPNISGHMVCRFLCGVFASSGLCMVGASISDMFPAATRGKAIAFFAFAPYCGPVFGPLVNGFVSVCTGRMDYIIWFNMAFAGVMWIIVSAIPETYAPVILARRAKRMRKETGDQRLMTEAEAQGVSFKDMMRACLLRPLYFAATEPVLDLTCGYVCLIYSLLYGFFFAYPVIFDELYGYKDNLIGLMFIPILIGACMALGTTFWCEAMYLRTIAKRKPTPEDRLLGAMVGAPFAAIALWMLGATSYKHLIWVAPASSGLAFGFGMVLIYYSLNNYIIDCYAMYASSALSTKVFLRSAGGAAFPLFTTQMYHNLGLQWASWLLAFIASGMIIIPFAFKRWGPFLRAHLGKGDYSMDAVNRAAEEKMEEKRAHEADEEMAEEVANDV
ncbi:ZYBA0S03-04368g1_1 [Zygosaccharomyces bailii CLIB 213]|uniref:ZYBA0S03-04368g1_1 n=1 Tax=Zygosaccharomyces bailii (strain CLIB 213 / ATCC 58445 / CBS 680 / BCRC 21525 / NBRC 1098 / NCYC 1416 / NRRL Y-2227) TaxID=1333698 RepID=A0A8J2T7Z3_ZYGB2|nr:ZYBA0S03-04368g1_1 [Zygosaccharomyces bailii CLIB 213]